MVECRLQGRGVQCLFFFCVSAQELRLDYEDACNEAGFSFTLLLVARTFQHIRAGAQSMFTDFLRSRFMEDSRSRS